MSEFFLRPFSYLKFNERVLSQALKTQTPRAEKLKFIAHAHQNLQKYLKYRAIKYAQNEDFFTHLSAQILQQSELIDLTFLQLKKEFSIEDHNLDENSLQYLKQEHLSRLIKDISICKKLSKAQDKAILCFHITNKKNDEFGFLSFKNSWIDFIKNNKKHYICKSHLIMALKEEILSTFENFETCAVYNCDSQNPLVLKTDKNIPYKVTRFLTKTLPLHKNHFHIQATYFFDYNLLFNLPINGERFALESLMPQNYFKKLIGDFAAILFTPYVYFDSFLRLLQQLCWDKDTKKITLSLYRFANESLVIKYLKMAHLNGKKVEVFLDTRARGCEEKNRQMGKTLKKFGIKVHINSQSHKLHAKFMLFEFKNKKALSVIGSGNFNESTTSVYSDIFYLTNHKIISNELKQFLDFLRNGNKKPNFQALLVAPINAKKELLQLIKNEDQTGETALKVNRINDDEIIQCLDEASKNTKISIINRDICTIENKKLPVKSIVGQFLEHARCGYFKQSKTVFVASFDFMSKNFEKRVELGVKIQEPRCQAIVEKIIQLQLKDECHSSAIDKSIVLDTKGFNCITAFQTPSFKELIE